MSRTASNSSRSALGTQQQQQQQQPNPRNNHNHRSSRKSTMSSSGVGVGKSSKKITIKPFVRPPQLPPNFYETTSKHLLEATQVVFLPKSSLTRQIVSQQTSYTSVVDLVSHQYGPKLYMDLQKSMREAAVHILGTQPLVGSSGIGSSMGMGTAGGGVGSSSMSVLSQVQQKYSVYVDYVLLCRHVFLPLDRTHIWQNGTVVKRNSASTTASSTTTTTAAATTATAITTTSATMAVGSGPTTPAKSNRVSSSAPSPKTNNTNSNSTLWDVGLAQFKERLPELHLDELLEEHFWTELWADWNGSNHVGGSGSDRFLLAKLIQMWQDLGLLPTILMKLQTRLESHLFQVSLEWRSAENYQPGRFLIFCYQKWMHVSQHWTFLPRMWLRTLVEVKLLKPHLNEQFLLHPIHFDALLLEDQSSTTAERRAVVGTAIYPPTIATSATNAFDESSFSSMTTLWMLASRIPKGLPQITKSICNYGRRQGLALVKSSSGPDNNNSNNNNPKKHMIPSLLALHSRLTQLVKKLPAGTTELLPPLKNVWDDILNDNASVAEYLAKHVDVQFRNMKLLNVQEFQEAVLQLFCHLQAKDVFEAFYKRDLAKRLLMGKVVSMDVERSMVTLLKSECGAGYTSKMEGMFQDVEWSRETMTRYKQSPDSAVDSAGGSTSLTAADVAVAHNTSSSSSSSSTAVVDMEVQVLTTGYWPVYPQHPGLILPESLKAPQDKFWNHYKAKYQGRRMTWQYALGNCMVRATFGNKRYDLVVSLCQSLVLCCFNFDEPSSSLTLLQVMKQTGIDDRAEVERLLQSLSLGKEGTRVLRKCDFVEHIATTTTTTNQTAPAAATGATAPKSNITKRVSKKIRQSVSDKDTFVVNVNFESNMRRIRINNIQWKETVEEREKTVEGVSRDRLYLIDAVLVRIMKARKTILHQQLIPQVLEQVKVPAQPSDVKLRIESLIEREYMERDGKDRQRYNYLA